MKQEAIERKCCSSRRKQHKKTTKQARKNANWTWKPCKNFGNMIPLFDNTTVYCSHYCQSCHTWHKMLRVLCACVCESGRSGGGGTRGIWGTPHMSSIYCVWVCAYVCVGIREIKGIWGTVLKSSIYRLWLRACVCGGGGKGTTGFGVPYICSRYCVWIWLGGRPGG